MAIDHIGSTSVPGLNAKKDLDILCVIDVLAASLKLQDSGYLFKGELNIPMRYFFSKNTINSKVNLHVVESDHGFIPLQLFFRDYLRSHASSRLAYMKLKELLIADPKNFERKRGIFTGYSLGKNEFIKATLEKAGFNNVIINFCLHDSEWDAAKHFRQTYFFDKAQVDDPYTWTFDHRDHAHFVLYQGANIIGYAHIQLWSADRAAIRIIVVEPLKRNQGYGGYFLQFIEKWLKAKGYKTIQAASRKETLQFYHK